MSGFSRVDPLGLNEGEMGEAGRNSVRRASGENEKIAGCAETKLQSGDAIIIETPTGGGYGERS